MNLLNGWSLSEDGSAILAPDGASYSGADPLTAAQIEEACGIPSHVTLWFNHSGEVPACDVIRELEAWGPALNTTEAGERLGLGRCMVSVLIRSGSLRAQRVGRGWLIRERDLEAVADRRPPGRPRRLPSRGGYPGDDRRRETR